MVSDRICNPVQNNQTGGGERILYTLVLDIDRSLYTAIYKTKSVVKYTKFLDIHYKHPLYSAAEVILYTTNHQKIYYNSVQFQWPAIVMVPILCDVF